MSDSELRKVFYAVDADDGGDVSLNELTDFIWGPGSAGRMATHTRQAKSRNGPSNALQIKKAPADAHFLKLTPSFERKVAAARQTQGKTRGARKDVDGMPRFHPLASLAMTKDETPGPDYNLQNDPQSIEARARKAKAVGKLRDLAQKSEARTRTVHAPTEAEQSMQDLLGVHSRSHWVSASAGEGAGGPAVLGHTTGLATNKKHIITGRCTFNA
jgi:hypothetical protein